VLGPGSWFTSVLPHLLVPELRAALETTPARRLVCLNLAEQPGETDGFSPEAHLEVLLRHAPGLSLDVVLADEEAVGDPRGLMAAVTAGGGRLVLAPVARRDGTPAAPPGAVGGGAARPDERPPDSTSRLRPTRPPPTCEPQHDSTRSHHEQHGGGPSMAMTAAVKDELSRLNVTRPCCRKAEIAALLRFAGGLHLVAGRIVVESELDTGSTARRLRKELAEVYGHASDVHVVAPGGLRKGNRYVVRVSKDGDGLARQSGLVDGQGRPVRGLPPQVVSGGTCDAAAAWRGPSWRTARSPSRAAPARWRSPARAGGGAGPGRLGPPARGGRQGARGPRGGPGRRARRRRDRRAAHPARRARGRAGLGGPPDAPGGAGHGQPAGQLRRREPAPVGPGRGGGRRAGGAGADDPGRRRPRAPARRGPAAPEHANASLEELGRSPTRR
jgi:hypothetical protein